MIFDDSILKSSFKVQCASLKQFGNEYLRVKTLLANHSILTDMIKEQETIYSMVDLQNQINISYCENYVTYIDNILNMIDYEYNRILQNEFFTNADSKWWYGIYSKSTFYRLKKKAMTIFLTYVI